MPSSICGKMELLAELEQRVRGRRSPAEAAGQEAVSRMNPDNTAAKSGRSGCLLPGIEPNTSCESGSVLNTALYSGRVLLT